MVIKPDEFRSLVDYYKGNITESSLLNRAARVAAEARLLIEDPHIPPALKEPRVKQLMRARGTLVKELRQGTAPTPSTSTTPTLLQDDDDRNIDSLQERMLKGLAQSINQRTDHVGNQVNQLQTSLLTPTTLPTTSTSTSETPKQPRPKRKVVTKKKLTFPKEKKPKKTPLHTTDEEDSWEAWDKHDSSEEDTEEDDNSEEDDEDLETSWKKDSSGIRQI